MQDPGCTLGLIGGIVRLPLFGWRPWADENDQNQASCLSVVGGLGQMEIMRVRHASSWGHPWPHRLHQPRARSWLESSGR